MALKLITPPAITPVSLAEVKNHLRVDHDADDLLIQTYIKAATAFVEGPGGFLGRALCEQTWDLVIDEFPADAIQIPLPPLIEIVHIKYDDGNGDELTLDLGDVTIDTDSEPGWIIHGGAWPSNLYNGVNAVRVRFIAGYSSGASPEVSEVPENIKVALLLHIGSMYAHREDVIVGQAVSAMPRSSEMLLRRHRLQVGMA